MGDYNLSALNTRDFQHLVQAIARKQIGAGVTAFGDGRDGARDLAFNGKMAYPPHDSPWDGYLVVGCKFCQRPTGDPKKDGVWALKQLEGDLKKFASSRRRLRRPNYYIFATNVALTAVDETGSRDRSVSLSSPYIARLGLSGFIVWDYHDIRGFLDGDRDVRAAYGHFITTGDVLQTIIETIILRRPDFADVMHRFLQKELIADMTAKLQSAGEDPELQIPLAKVFVDLPYADTPQAAAFAHRQDESGQHMVVQRLLRAGSAALRRPPPDDAIQVSNEEVEFTPSRFVVVGGPGQGKSTLGQHLCQLYRAAILNDRPPDRLDDRVMPIVKQLADLANNPGGLPLARRFPIRVELRSFSHALMKDRDLTLLDYIRRDISKLGGADVDASDLRAWLGAYPWLIVLDGLDEVPPSSNRTDVMKQVGDFRVDAAAANADVLIVATTRPQSYSREFTEDAFRHLYLTPLRPEHAIAYGRKLADARCAGDDRRHAELIRSLEKACKNEATARLMQSPLQVTIMATLLEETGEPPQQRYRLFAEYYRTIYKRETRRNLLGGILSEHQTDIDMIHYMAGLLLQLFGEANGDPSGADDADDTESALSDQQFRELVARRLRQIEVSGPKAAELLSRITDGSLQRLVFLVRPGEGRVRFDITSLKEFMAAEALMTGMDDDVRKGLEAIAGAAYWRNVFLFAVGKCFVQKEHMLDHISGICSDLNEENAACRVLASAVAGRAAKAAQWGSRLALDILADGTSRQYPKYEVRFARLALELVKSDDPNASSALAAVYHDDLGDLYREAVNDRLGQADFHAQIPTWNLLIGLAERGVQWAREVADERWPASAGEEEEIIAVSVRGASSEWYVGKLASAVGRLSPSLLQRWHPHLSRNKMLELLRVIDGTAHSLVSGFLAGARTVKAANRTGAAGLASEFTLVATDANRGVWSGLPHALMTHPDWREYVSACRFGDDPCARSLAFELDSMAELFEPGRHAAAHRTPWPLGACLRAARSKSHLRDMAERARRGGLGDIDSWRAAEERWSVSGVCDADFFALCDERWPFDAEVAKLGFPLSAAFASYDTPCTAAGVHGAVSLIRSLPHEIGRKWTAAIILDVLSMSQWGPTRSALISVGEYREVWMVARGIPQDTFGIVSIDALAEMLNAKEAESDWLSLLEEIGRGEGRFQLNGDEAPFAEACLHRYCADPIGNRGLAPALATIAMVDPRIRVPQAVLDVARGLGGPEHRAVRMLELAGEELCEEKIGSLAAEIVRGGWTRYQVWRSLQIALQQSPERHAALALAILDAAGRISQASSDPAHSGRDALVRYLTERPSSLDRQALSVRLPLLQNS